MKSGYISIIGKPNSGKSTLLNRILGEQLSIVTHKAQTTRHKVVGIHNIPGAQMVFLDTPGIHESQKTLNQYMMEVVDAAVKDADVICWVEDVSQYRTCHDKICHSRESGNLVDLDSCLRRNDLNKRNLVIVLNKIDLILGKSWKQSVKEFREDHKDCEVVAVSA